MTEIFKAAIKRGASDIHIKSGDVVRARINGELVRLTEERMNRDQVKELARKLLPESAPERDNIDALHDYDCAWSLPGLGRFRVNILRQRGSFMIVLRVIPFEVPTIDELDLPEVLKTISDHERGLILVTGVTGSGKSSTMAAMVSAINRAKPFHVVTLENPIEFLHRDYKASITQRDIGSDTESFKMGLRASLRQDPDVILVGEMRDKETIDIALRAAETGHLVISTVHTKNAVQTLSRLIAVFDADEQAMIRIRLSESLQAVISQRLIPRKSGGRIAAVEVMRVTGTIRDCIADKDRMDEIFGLMESGRSQYGSQSFDQHLMQLVEGDVVDFKVAMAAANNPADFDLQMNTFGARKGGGQAGEPSQDMSGEMNQMFGGR